MRATTSTALLAALTGSASAHMMLSYPAPFNSKYNQFADSGKIDYSYTAPLAADGSDYPCKGYQSDLGTSAGQPTASFAIGGQGNITVVGGAAHGGGSCQISLSTDGAKTFTVIQSIVGNCPVNTEGNFDFTVPSDVPAGDAVLAWSWNNRIGNREFYMNCAAVTLTGGSAKREATDKRAAAFSSRPQIFVANIGNGCNVAEGGDVNYPDPGPDVVNNSDNPEAPSGSCGSTGSFSGSGSSDSGSAASSSSSASVEATPAAGGIFATVSASVEVPAVTAASTTLATVTSAEATPTPDAAASTPAAAAGSSSGSTAASSGSTAAGSACTTEGEWNCIDGSSFQRCASGTWSAVQSMAAGTSCESGVAANLKMVGAKRAASHMRFHQRRVAA
ncbi:hypothetical protein Daus18300_007520 [Diaporthe australafricana]|uniref:Endoglucanase n=1 Tax=Diaporthe australafricana TaxID=127596 RepID=A0ABR3WM98_9PEZI